MKFICARFGRDLEDSPAPASVLSVVVTGCNLYFLNRSIRRYKQGQTLNSLCVIDSIQDVGVVIGLTSVDIHVEVFAGVFRMKVKLAGGHRNAGRQQAKSGNVIAEGGKISDLLCVNRLAHINGVRLKKRCLPGDRHGGGCRTDRQLNVKGDDCPGLNPEILYDVFLESVLRDSDRIRSWQEAGKSIQAYRVGGGLVGHLSSDVCCRD